MGSCYYSQLRRSFFNLTAYIRISYTSPHRKSAKVFHDTLVPFAERRKIIMILKDIWLDVKAVKERDPAARNALEVLLMYQGIHALIWHRIAHAFYEHRLFFIARLISQIARFFTLIEIHPGAKLGHGILIDHGCGVVIGETAVVGDNCTIYQGVTLGGVGTQKGKRHPTLGNYVTVGAGAKILGSFEVGDNCYIAANAVLLQPLANNITAVGIPARPVKKDGVALPKKQKMILGEHDRKLMDEMEALRKEVKSLKRELALMRAEQTGVSSEGGILTSQAVKAG